MRKRREIVYLLRDGKGRGKGAGEGSGAAVVGTVRRRRRRWNEFSGPHEKPEWKRADFSSWTLQEQGEQRAWPTSSKPLQNLGLRNAFELGEGYKVTCSTETQDIISVKDLMLEKKQGVGCFVCWLELSWARWGSGTHEIIFIPRKWKVNAKGSFLFMAHVTKLNLSNHFTNGTIKERSCF